MTSTVKFTATGTFVDGKESNASKDAIGAAIKVRLGLNNK